MNYDLLLAGKLLAALIVALLGLRAVWLFAKCEKSYMLADIWTAFRSRAVKVKWLLVFFSLLFLGLVLVIQLEGRRQNYSLLVALTYPEASDGLNPNGSRYNMSNILCDEVLERAIALGGLEDIGVEALISALEVAPASAIDKNGDDEDEDEDEGRTTVGGLVPTQFLLSFSGNSKTGSLGGEEVVYAVAEAYRGWFIEQYSVNSSVLEISFEDIDNYDYLIGCMKVEIRFWRQSGNMRRCLKELRKMAEDEVTQQVLCRYPIRRMAPKQKLLFYMIKQRWILMIYCLFCLRYII